MADALCLEGKLDLAAASDLRDTLLAQPPGDVVVDLGAVTLMGALCAQVLVAAAASLQAKGHALQITNCPDPVAGHFAAMGLSPDTLTGSTA